MIADKLHLDYIFVSHSPINEFTSEEYIDFPALSTGSSNILENRNIPISREFFKYSIHIEPEDSLMILAFTF